MNIVLWIVQGLVAVAFLGAGAMKLTQPIASLSKNMSWAAEIPQGLVRFIGLAEVLGAIGIVLPRIIGSFVSSFSGIGTALTIAAAIGLALVMVLAVGFHLSRNESARIAPNIVLLLLAVLVLVGRTTFAKF